MLKASVLALALLSSQAPAAPIYDVKVDLDHTSTGTTTFVVDKDGNVSGTLHIEAPDVAEAKLAGSIKDGVWTYKYPFSMPDRNCTGTVAGMAKVTADQASVSGSMTVSGACTDQPMDGTFTFTRRSK